MSVSDATGFRVGDQALLIQMQGATISTENSAEFGDVTNLGHAGRYEKVIISDVSGTSITFQYRLLNRYDPDGALQLVSMPLYDQAIVRQTLQAKPWDGSSGGVIALEVTETLLMEADIDASGLGFRGGVANNQQDTECTFITNTRTYGLPLGDWQGAAKGEGIAKYITGLEAGRGPQANGGGGANDHNAGGGGGANVNRGGHGGRNDEPSFFGCTGSFPGDGGKALVADTSRVYLGGGGGAGDENNDVSTDGGHGGGIVLLSVKTLEANGFAIRANGEDVGVTTGDGGGGGGAGGTIVLQGETLTGTLNVEARGGNGGNIDNRDQDRCHGPGGGGSGGYYLGPASWSPTVNLDGGEAGVSSNSAASGCGATENLAESGQPGIRQVKNGLPESQITSSGANIANVTDLPPACEGTVWQVQVGVEGQNLQLQWQILEGDMYTDLQEESPYTGIQTDRLRIDPLTRELDGAQYRLKVTATCGEALFSDPVLLKVDELPTGAFSFTENDLEITFNNQSTGASSFSWSFGDGNTSEEDNPVHTYSRDGDYEVSLIVRNDCGADTVRQTLDLAVGAAPKAAFSFTPTSGCAPLQIQFTNESTGEYTGVQWRFSGGVPASSIEENPVVTFTESGTFTFALVVTGPLGTDVLMLEEQIDVGKTPMADFSFTTDDRTVSFQNNSTGGETYQWRFGDGEESVEDNPIHTYAMAGDYEVSLITTNECGADTSLLSLQVGLAPQAGFSFSPASGCSPLDIQFTNESVGSFTEVLWRFPGGEPATSTDPNPVVRYAQSGTYAFTLLVNGPLGQDSLVRMQEVEVLTPPTAAFSLTTEERTVYFQNTSTGADIYTWRFGDGSEDSAVIPKYTYSASGDYEITLITNNSCGADTAVMTVSVGLAPQAAFSFTPAEGCAPLEVQFSNESTGDFTEIEWEFPGGAPASSTDANPLVSYSQSGTYSFTLRLAGPFGEDSLALEQTLTILPLPVADFSYTADDRSIQFLNNATGADTFRWLFGDGAEATDANPEHTYADYGSYEVILIATNACGPDTLRSTVEVGAPPQARYAIEPMGGCAPVQIRFSNQSTGNFTSFEWTFPGGSPASSTEPNPVVRYETPGLYGFRLSVEGPLGTDQVEVENTLDILPIPEPAFSYELRGDTLILENLSTDARSYRWNFGDGTTSGEENPIHVYGQNGTFDVTLNATNPYCGKSTAKRVSVVITSAEEALRAAGISLYPNPLTDFLHIAIKDNRLFPLEFTLINSTGQTLERRELLASQSFSLEHFPAGGYYVLLRSAQGSWVSKVVKLSR